MKAWSLYLTGGIQFGVTHVISLLLEADKCEAKCRPPVPVLSSMNCFL